MNKKNDISLVLFLGACPILANSAGLWQGVVAAAAMAVIMLVFSLLPAKKLGVFGCFIAAVGLATAAQMTLSAFWPSAAAGMGSYLAVSLTGLIAVRQAEVNRLGHTVKSILTLAAAIVVTASLRELFGAGAIGGMEIAFFKAHTINILAQAPGAFIIFAFVAALFNGLTGGGRIEAAGELTGEAAGLKEER